MDKKLADKLRAFRFGDERDETAHDLIAERNEPAVYELYVLARADAKRGEEWDAGLYLYGEFENERAAYLYFRDAVAGIALREAWRHIECTMKRQGRPTWEGRFVIEGPKWGRGDG